MTKIIYKYALERTDRAVVAMPEGAEILTAQLRHNQICLWALVNPERPTEDRIVEIHGTGNPIQCDMGIERKYIGTVQEGRFAWHVFERVN